jgi:phosphonate transport system substrate-binding protein
MPGAADRTGEWSTVTWLPRAAIAGVVLLLSAAVTACGDDEQGNPTGQEGWPDRIVFAATPSGEARSFDFHYGLFVRALSEEVGIRVDTFQAADYAGVIEGLIAGTVDVAQLGAFSYALAVQNGAKIKPAGVLHHRKTDKPGYVVVGVAPAGSAASSFADFRGKTVCFPDPASTSTLLPLFEFAKAGLVPDRDFTRLTVPLGNTIPRTVKKGDCEVGIAADVQLENAIRTGDVAARDLKVFWRLQAPGSPLAHRSTLPQDLQDKIRTATLKINAEYLERRGWCKGDDCLITANRDFGYKPVDAAYYNVIWDACKATRIEACGPIGS